MSHLDSTTSIDKQAELDWVYRALGLWAVAETYEKAAHDIKAACGEGSSGSVGLLKWAHQDPSQFYKLYFSRRQAKSDDTAREPTSKDRRIDDALR